jgi:hypothetical protein
MLEINVFDESKVVDSMGDAVVVMERIIQKILASDSDIPVTITVKRVKNNSPPALGINVGETVVIKDRLV